MSAEAIANPQLLDPFVLGPLTLHNRVVMAPLTRNRADPRNVPTELNRRYYRQRASAGLIITEGAQISPQGVGYPGTPGIHNRSQIQGWRRITDGVHEAGGHIFLQLWHVGRISHPDLQPGGALPVAPSAIAPQGEAITASGPQPFVTPRALATEELADIVEQYEHAAENAWWAEFDGIEIHAANGYLLDQFLRDGSNRRQDQYGGSMENRARLLLEVVEALSRIWPSNRIGVRLSPEHVFNDMHDSNPQTLFEYVARRLSPFSLAYLHVLEGNPMSNKPRGDFDYARLHHAFQGTYMANGGYGQVSAQQAIASGQADLVAFGRLFLANPDLPARFSARAGLNEPDPDTFYGGGEAGYTDYPALPG